MVIECFIEGWPAYSKWNLEYIKSVAGDKVVPLYDDRPVDYKDGFNEPHAKMKMADYIDLLKKEPTKFRIFFVEHIKRSSSITKRLYVSRFWFEINEKFANAFFWR